MATQPPAAPLGDTASAARVATAAQGQALPWPFADATDRAVQAVVSAPRRAAAPGWPAAIAVHRLAVERERGESTESQRPRPLLTPLWCLGRPRCQGVRRHVGPRL